jgi:hypothetical protein
MAWTDADLQKLRETYIAIATGPQEVAFADGRRVKYNTPEAVAAAIAVVEAKLLMAQASASGVVRRRTPYYRSGL